jgi:hypothetical protein
MWAIIVSEVEQKGAKLSMVAENPSAQPKEYLELQAFYIRRARWRTCSANQND